MNEEFAIEPTSFEDIRDYKYVLGKFGFNEGRFIAAIPRKWLRDVYIQIEKMPDGINKQRAKRLVEITKERGGIFYPSLEYDQTKPWLSNVKFIEDKFYGILVSSSCNVENPTEKLRTIEDADDSFFGSSRDVRMIANVESYTEIAKKLLSISTSIVLIDPYFNFARPDNIKILEEYIRVGLSNHCKNFVIYSNAEKSKPKGINQLLKDFWNKFKNDTLKLKLVFLKEGNSKNAMHARYLLSEYGAIRFDKGFNISADLNIDVSPVDLRLHQDLRTEFLDGKHDFLVDSTYCSPES